MRNPVNILLVEDDEVDAMAVTRGLKAYRVGNPITVARDGIEALEFLRGANGRAPLPRPNMVILDINLPRMNGLEFLEAVRRDPELSDTIIFVLTTSAEEQDITRAYKCNIAGYMTKRNAGEDFFSLFKMLSAYWSIIVFPPGPDP